jgi:hypothetical protein
VPLVSGNGPRARRRAVSTPKPAAAPIVPASAPAFRTHEAIHISLLTFTVPVAFNLRQREYRTMYAA